MDNITEEERGRFDAALRKIDPREQMASPVLTDKQWVVYRELQRRLRHPEHFQFGLFAGASISAFFNPEDFIIHDNYLN